MKTCTKGLHQYEGRRCTKCARAYIKHWKTINQDKVKAAKKHWHVAHEDYSKTYYQEHKELDKSRRKVRYYANLDQERANKRLSYNKNKEVFRLRNKAWRKANPAKTNAINAKRRAAKLRATPSWLTELHCQQIEIFYSAAAELSKEFGFQVDVDHIVPLQGKNVSGLHVPWNLQLLPSKLNNSKGNRI